MAATDSTKQDTKQEIIAILKEADSLLSKSHGWTRLALCRNTNKRPVLISDPEAQSFCLSGSVLRAGLDRKSSEGTVRTTLNVLSKLCRILYGKGIQKYGTKDDFNEFKRFPLAYTNDGLLKSPLEARKILQDAIQSLSRRSVSEMGGDGDNTNAPAAADANKAAAAPAVAAAGIPAGEVSRSEAQTLVADSGDYDDEDDDDYDDGDYDEDEDEDDAGAANVAAPPAIPAAAPSPDAPVIPAPEASAAPSPDAPVIPAPEASAAPSPDAPVIPAPDASAAPSPDAPAIPAPEASAAPSSDTPAAPSPDAADEANTLMHISEQPVELDPKKPAGMDHTDSNDIDMPDLDLDLLNDDEDEDDE